MYSSGDCVMASGGRWSKWGPLKVWLGSRGRHPPGSVAVEGMRLKRALREPVLRIPMLFCFGSYCMMRPNENMYVRVY